MLKRILIWVLFLIVAAAAVYFFLLNPPGKEGAQSLESALPLEVRRLIPLAWDTRIGGHKQCDFDGDHQNEWLVIYRYDSVTARQPDAPKATGVDRALIGAAIYDARLDPQAPGDPSQYPATSITPYRLLPDFTAGKGQGYLGESKVALFLFPPAKNATCAPEEIAFLGYSDDDQAPLPTRLSIFRWYGEQVGYRTAHFVGSARVDTPGPLDGTSRIAQVTTYNRLNDRSRLCESRTFGRDINRDTLTFDENFDAFTVDFCFGAPPEPMYPEAAVVAFLRGYQPDKANDQALLPPGNSYLLSPGVALPAGLQRPTRILSVEHYAAATLTSGDHTCEADFGAASKDWLCGQQEATIRTEVPLGATYQFVTWRVISVTRADVVDDIHWRIAQATAP